METKEKKRAKDGVLPLRAEAKAKAGQRARAGEKFATARERACGVLMTINGPFSPIRVRTVKGFPGNI